jgi:hypothetical protein
LKTCNDKVLFAGIARVPAFEQSVVPTLTMQLKPVIKPFTMSRTAMSSLAGEEPPILTARLLAMIGKTGDSICASDSTA